MALSPKLKNNTPAINEEDLILKGGSSGKQEKKQLDHNNKIKNVSLRISNNYLNRIGDLLEKRAGNISRHTWIIEAIVEKLGKEENHNDVS